jgi:hypothetical protein
MKDIMTAVTFVMGALCFAIFLITVKPDPLSAVPTRVSPRTAKWWFLVSQYAVTKPSGRLTHAAARANHRDPAGARH